MTITTHPDSPLPAGNETSRPASPVAEVSGLLAREGYFCDRGLAAAVFLADRLRRPLFLEGEPGVGKTELAKTFAAARGARLIRLQCYEGIDIHQALYDWNYAKQMLYIRALQRDEETADGVVRHVFSEDFLIRRPLLEALDSTEDVVLLVDEIDRADDEFEAFLLEVLSDFQVSIPEIGTVQATNRPVVILTSNRTREVHDAVKRRCFYHWIEFPDYKRQMAILRSRVPGIPPGLAEQICTVIARMRSLNLHKPPGVGETLDWALAVTELGVDEFDERIVEDSIGAVLKVREDQERVLAELFPSGSSS